MPTTTKKQQEQNGWTVWENFVLEELKRLNGHVEKIDTSITDVKVDIGKLKVKSGVWGLIGGSIPVVTGLIIYVASIVIQHMAG